MSVKRRSRLVAAILLLASTGCSMVAGHEDSLDLHPAFRVSIVETLRNQKSLREERYKEFPAGIFSSGTDTASLQQPISVYADDFRVFVADAYFTQQYGSASVFLFNRADLTVSIIRGMNPSLPADQQIKLLAPSAVAVDALGIIYVADSQQGRVFGYDQSGRLLITFGKFGELSFPSGIAVDKARRRLYVADRHAHRVRIFDTTTGTLIFGTNTDSVLSEIGASGELSRDVKFPTAVALDRAGNVYVLDSQLKRVQTFDPEGRYVKTCALTGDAPGAPLKPHGLAIDSAGRLFVTDSAGGAILVFDAQGELVATWGRSGKLYADFRSPTGIFIDDRDKIYVADELNSRVQVFQTIK